MSRVKAAGARTSTILIVDDTPANLGVVVDNLESIGHRVLVAQDGEEALKRASLMRPDLLLLDVLMPGIDGFETCRRLKAAEGTKDIPVIFMTCLTDTTDKLVGFEAGGVDYITKPFDIGEAVARVTAHLSLREAQRELEAKNAQLQHEMAIRQQNEAALQRAHEELEQRVRERTAELASLNAALVENQHLLQAIVDNSTAVIFVKDIEGRYLMVNRRYQELFHVTQQSIVGKTDHDLFPKEHADAYRAFDRWVMAAGTSMEAEEIVPQDDGLHTYISIKCPILDGAGRPHAMCGIATDITERKQAEVEIKELNDSLERRVEQRTRELLEAQKELVATARRAGMAEIASNVLHNVGNVLNSVNVGAQLASQKIRESRVQRLPQLAQMLTEHKDDLGSFLTQDEKGRQLPTYLRELADHLCRERASLQATMASLTENIAHIKMTVQLQQSYAGVSEAPELVSPAALLADALGMSTSALGHHPIEVVQDYQAIPPVRLDKHKVLQILINLIRNAHYALRQSDTEHPLLTLRLRLMGPRRLRMEVSDNGVGIAKENLTRIFQHGFTTRPDGHGFGLHSGALAARAMGGSLTAESEGLGTGATFTLEVPLISL
jgi:PAS domain S-box-containing protein